jgi:hypothetical protein
MPFDNRLPVFENSGARNPAARFFFHGLLQDHTLDLRGRSAQFVDMLVVTLSYTRRDIRLLAKAIMVGREIGGHRRSGDEKLMVVKVKIMGKCHYRCCRVTVLTRQVQVDLDCFS